MYDYQSEATKFLNNYIEEHPEEAQQRLVNRNVENWVRRFPEQYLFAYNRYKHPAGAPLPPQE